MPEHSETKWGHLDVKCTLSLVFFFSYYEIGRDSFRRKLYSLSFVHFPPSSPLLRDCPNTLVTTDKPLFSFRQEHTESRGRIEGETVCLKPQNSR